MMDSYGLEYWTDENNKIHHKLKTTSPAGEVDLSYENIIEHMTNLDSWKSFHVDQYTDGIPMGCYYYRLNLTIMLDTPEFVRIARVFNPEFLL